MWADVRTGRLSFCVVVAFAVLTVVVHAHHSLTGIYDSDATVTIDGRVVRFHFVNPHPYVVVEVFDTKGIPADWRLDMDNRHELEAIGMTATTLMPDDLVTATGMRGRDNANRIYVRRLERPADRFWYEQVGSSPRMRRDSAARANP